jgi:acetate kinase
MDSILALEADAAGVSFQLFSVQGEGRLGRQIHGRLAGIGGRPRLKAWLTSGEPMAHRAYRKDNVGDVAAAFDVIDAWLRDELGVSPLAVGHRVARGGPDDTLSVLIDDAVMARLEQLIASAPLHQPHNLAPIRAMRARYPALPQVACFGAAFHLSWAAQPDVNARPSRRGAEAPKATGSHDLACDDEFAIARHTLALLLNRPLPAEPGFRS